MRTCARQGCPQPVTSTHRRARFCSSACKSADWRARSGYVLVGQQEACQTRKKRGGRQVSYRKAVTAMTEVLVEGYAISPYVAQLVAESTMTYALSHRQRNPTL